LAATFGAGLRRGARKSCRGGVPRRCELDLVVRFALEGLAEARPPREVSVAAPRNERSAELLECGRAALGEDSFVGGGLPEAGS